MPPTIDPSIGLGAESSHLNSFDVGVRTLGRLLDLAPHNPAETDSDVDGLRGAHLYNGLAGLLLAARSTDEPFILERLRDIALPAVLTMSVANPFRRPGLFHGLTGLAVTSGELVNLAAAEDVDEVTDVVDELIGRLLNVISQEWELLGMDMMSGAPGIGLGLLALADRYGGMDLVARAEEMARLVCRVSTPPNDWVGVVRDPESGLVYLNYSHGLSGIAFFLARAGRRTESDELISAAERLCHELWATATPVGGDGLLSIPRVLQVPTLSLGYEGMGWCHGVSGTMRLWAEIRDITSNSDWDTPLDHALEYLRRIGQVASEDEHFTFKDRLESRNPKLPSLSVCHGVAGVLNALVALKGTRVGEQALKIADSYASVILRAGEALDDGSMRWREWYVNQHDETGDPSARMRYVANYMVGGAGIAASLAYYGRSRVGTPSTPLPDLIGTPVTPMNPTVP